MGVSYGQSLSSSLPLALTGAEAACKSSPGIQILGQSLKLSSSSLHQPLLEQRPPTGALQASRSWASLLSCHHLTSSLSLTPTGAEATCKSSPGIPILGQSLKLSSSDVIIAFDPYWSRGHLQELSRHPDQGPVSQVVIIIFAIGPYWSRGHLQELSRHPDPGPVSQVVPRCSLTSLFLSPDCGASVCWQ